MKEKPTCRICFTKFTRGANMRKHMQTVHGVFERSTKKPPTFGHSVVPQVGISELNGNTVHFQTPTTPFDKSLEQLSNLAKLAPYGNLVASLQAIDEYRNKIAMYEQEIATLKSHNWIIPNSEIQGLTGYVCRRCNQIAFDGVRNIGYDMTMLARHTCDEEKVKSIKVVSIRPVDVWNLNDTAAGIIIEKLNYLMPSQKYLLATDTSKSFDSLERMVNPSLVKFLLGIPDRYYLYSVKSDEKIRWLERAIANLGRRTIVEDSEVRDLLRRVKSTYAIFEIPRGESLRRILIKITK